MSNNVAMATTYSTQEHPPPNYQESNPPLLNLTYLSNIPPPSQPCIYRLSGDSRDPDLIMFHGLDRDSTTPIMTLSTESTLLYHHTHIQDHRPGGVMHIMKRRDNLPNDELLYTITTHGANGTKIVEITTLPTILSAASTRLVFRRTDDGTLDAVRLKTFLPGDAKGKLEKLDMAVEYQGSMIGRITMLAKPEKPVYELSIDAVGVDPVLFAILAAVVDDRLMTKKRRNRRGLFSGIAGVGKGPGAGLAAAYAVS